MWRCLAFLAACGASPQRSAHPVVVASEHQLAHYRNWQYRIGAVIDLGDADHPMIRLDGDRVAERLDRRGTQYVDRHGRPILQMLDQDSVVVFVHGGSVGVALGRDRDLATNH